MLDSPCGCLFLSDYAYSHCTSIKVLGKINYMATKKIVVRTGAKVPVSGQYRAGSGKAEATLIKGHRIPPNRAGKLETWHLVDKTRHLKNKR